MYSSTFTAEALDNVKKLPKNIRNALKKEFEKTLHVDPVGCSVRLSDPLEEYRGFHFDEYRVVFKVFEDIKVIAVVGVGKKDANHHAEIYRHLESLAKSGKLAATMLETYRSLNPKA